MAGLAAGVVVTTLGAVVNHVLGGRREAAARRLQVLRARYDEGRKALDVYLGHFDSPYEGLEQGEAEHLKATLEEPFGLVFAEQTVMDFFDTTVTRERFDARIAKMREQLVEWERELSFPPRKDLGSEPPVKRLPNVR